MYILLKFRYILAVALFFSCGNNPDQKKADTSTTTESAVIKPSIAPDSKTILFFGNSLTAAYGLRTEEGFPNLLQQRMDSLHLGYRVINSGLSGETTSGGLNRLDWVLNQPVAIFVLELGANDGLRGIPLSETRNNLQEIIDKVRNKNKHTQIILAGMQIPPNMGQDYTMEFKAIYPSLAQANNIPLIPFLLEGVAGNPDLNLPDGIHPTAEGQKIVANNVWEVLKPMVMPAKKEPVDPN